MRRATVSGRGIYNISPKWRWISHPHTHTEVKSNQTVRNYMRPCSLIILNMFTGWTRMFETRGFHLFTTRLFFFVKRVEGGWTSGYSLIWFSIVSCIGDYICGRCISLSLSGRRKYKGPGHQSLLLFDPLEPGRAWAAFRISPYWWIGCAECKGSNDHYHEEPANDLIKTQKGAHIWHRHIGAHYRHQ